MPAAIKAVTVGDHDTEVVPHPRALRRQAELFAVRKMSWSVEEYRALAERYADAVQAFQIAVANESFAGIRSAYLTLEEIAGQTKSLNTGFFHAIEAAQQESSRDRS